MSAKRVPLLSAVPPPLSGGTMHHFLLPVLACCILTGPIHSAEKDAEKPKMEKGAVRFELKDDQKNVPKQYRLDAHTFDFEMEKKADVNLKGVEVYQLRFPSPVTTEHKENNTVHAEYYRPEGKGPFPAVIVLDITAGSQVIPRTMAAYLASHKIAGLFVQMAYYGPRRPEGSSLRLMSMDYRHTFAAIRQTVLDVRRASAWLESRPEIDGKKIGVAGTSLGSFIGTLAAEMEPRLSRVAVILGGGGLVDAYYDDPRAEPFRKVLDKLGLSKERLKKLFAPVDPITYAANIKDRKVLIIAAKRDDVVPPKAAEALWEATGKQKIVWYDCNHVGAAVYIVSILGDVAKHFGE